MAKGCEKYEKRQEAADARRAESSKSYVKKEEAHDPGLPDPSDIGASNGSRGDRQSTTRLPGSVKANWIALRSCNPPAIHYEYCI
jgi:hypothetical protein